MFDSILNKFDFLFSTEKRIEKITREFKIALSSGDNHQALSLYGKGFSMLLDKERYTLLANFIRTALPQLPSSSQMPENLTSESVLQASTALEKSNHLTEAIMLLETYQFEKEYMELLAKKGMADKLVNHIIKNQTPSSETISILLSCWEKYNGKLMDVPAFVSMIKNLAQYSSVSLPHHPEILEITGCFQEAAELYQKIKDLPCAARCHEANGAFEKAHQLFLDLKDNNGISRTAEALGDLEEALQYAQDKSRQISLLIKMERFHDAIGLSPDEGTLKNIQERIRESIQMRLARKDFIQAMEWSCLVDDSQQLQNSILKEAREASLEQLKTATDAQQIRNIHETCVRLEELAGNYETAAKIVLEVLKDKDRASRLYEKAENYHMAIALLPEEDRLHLAELHEKGGNTLTAAQIYEGLGKFDKASSLFEQLNNYSKAADCYSKIPNADLSRLAALYENANQFEQAISAYLQINTIQSLDNAKAIAHARELTDLESQIDQHLALLMRGSEEDILICIKKAGDTVLDTYSFCLGIDFGTTNSVGAIYNKKTGRTEVIPVPNHAGSYLEPSFFGVDENARPIFGEDAKKRSIIAPDSAVSRVKRSFGVPYNNYPVGGHSYKAEQIAAMIINKIKENAETYLLEREKQLFLKYVQEQHLAFPESKLLEIFDANKRTFTLIDVVLTVPAFYNDNQKRATRDAAEVAALNVKRLLHEPTAAALAYYNHKPINNETIVAVIDFGGGTLDISLLEIAEGEKTSKSYKVLDVQGNIALGGSDIDRTLMNHVCQEIKDRHGIDFVAQNDKISLGRLRNACEDLKINLSSTDKYTMVLHNLGTIQTFEYTLSRSELETVAANILDKFKKTLTTIQAPKNYILVGNACKMPAIQRIVRETWPDSKEQQGIDVGSIVAQGAALEGAVLSQDLQDALIMDIVPYSLGISIHHDDTDEISTLIPRQTIIPCEKTKSYTTTHDNQTAVDILIYQGESIDPNKNYKLGKFSLENIKPAPKGTPKIDVTFKIGADCILTVKAIDSETGNQQSIKIDGAIALSSSEKERLKDYFENTKRISQIAEEFKQLEEKAKVLNHTYQDMSRRNLQEYHEFNLLFQERVETHHQLYTPTDNATSAIQRMYGEKDHIPRKCQHYQDQFSSAYRSLESLFLTKIHYENHDPEELQQRRGQLYNGIASLSNIISNMQQEIHSTLLGWNKLLRSFKPNYDALDPVSALRTSLLSHDEATARKNVQKLENSQDEMTEEIFDLRLKYYRQSGQRPEYINLCKQHGRNFGMIIPDFNDINIFLEAVIDSIGLIIVQTAKGTFSGSGFAIGKRLFVTNRHVVEGGESDQITIYCKGNRILRVTQMEIDPFPVAAHDMAVLHVTADVPPLRIGEFNFIQPGDKVLAVGFPEINRSKNLFEENLYISRGIVNALRAMEEAKSPEKVILTDAKLNHGISGGPLFNELGEVIGICQGAIGIHKIAVPTKLLEKYLI